MMARSGIYSSIRKDYLGNGSRAVHPCRPARKRHNVPMDPHDLGYPPSSPSFASFIFVCRGEIKW